MAAPTHVAGQDVEPQGDPWLLRWDLAKTNFLDRDLPPAFLYYNPWPEEKSVTVEAAGKGRVHDLTTTAGSRRRVESCS